MVSNICGPSRSHSMLSGCGKSTILRLALGLDTPDARREAIGNRPVSEAVMASQPGRVAAVFDVVRAWRGGKGAAFRFVRIPNALPAVLSGLQVAAPNAILGAILAEFDGGGRWGLGAYLIGSLGRAEPDRLRGTGLVATLATGTGLGNLLNRARGMLDYGMIWSVAFVSVVLSVIAYKIVEMVERARSDRG